ncbi:hypothetical protein [Streptomyces sp. NPDC018031]|uniref:hypothetical protein n=1 Tax=Streptomyces sp. NPDC018031 TaxID=3365033 RepID=UPI0037B2A235
MSFEREWQDLRGQASADVRMRLNGEHGGGAADLTVRRDDLGAIGNEAYALRTTLSKAGDDADQVTSGAATALTQGNFVSGAALTKANDRWSTQLKTLLDACARISNHLDYSKAAHDKDELDIQGSLASVSKISEYWK